MTNASKNSLTTSRSKSMNLVFMNLTLYVRCGLPLMSIIASVSDSSIRDLSLAVARYPFLVAKSFLEGLTKANPYILYGVMIINLDIALCCQFEIEKSMLGEESEHVVEERYAGLYGALALAVDVKC